MGHSCDWWLLQASRQDTAKEEARSPIWVEADEKARLLILSISTSWKVFTKNSKCEWFNRILNFNVNSMIFIIYHGEHQTLHISYNQLSFTNDIPFFFIIKGIFLCLDVVILLYFIY